LKSPPLGFLAEFCGLIALIFTIVAVFRVGEGLGYSMLVRVVLAMVAAIPLANLVMLFVLYARARQALARDERRDLVE
jgi:magnesium-transporting ATPase (P-type)